MKALFTPLAHEIVKKAKRNKFLQHLFEAPIDPATMQPLGKFSDSFGNEITLRKGLRELIRPHWREIYTKPPLEKPAYQSKLRDNAKIDTEKLLALLKSQGESILGKTVLEIGANKGAATYAYAEAGASKVLGSDFSGYQVASDALEGGNLESAALVNSFYGDFRETLRKHYTFSGEVAFVDDDICQTRLEANQFDLIFSSQVLEHLDRPFEAFQSMYSVLKKGGYMVHEYNPFFCLNGGHSLCTLDMLWGHVRLNEQDLASYLSTYRPDEKDRALAFFKNGINRMTLKDTRKHIEDSGFENIEIIPLPKEQHMRMVSNEIFSQVKNLYPGVEILDLCAPRVFLIARKP
ncbi:MAG: class I SAM-dependent methyltransferase [Schleiferiaceae bacterium]|nr:class I SAM-dependent methyltransferase [Schleiferiaceae bacterium]